jgi:hypothetical protein
MFIPQWLKCVGVFGHRFWNAKFLLNKGKTDMDLYRLLATNKLRNKTGRTVASKIMGKEWQLT